MEERRRFEDFVTSFSARFIDLPADEVEAAIDGALLEMLDALGSDRAGFVAYDEGGGPPRSAHVVARPGIETYDVSQLLQWAWFLGQLTAGREIRLSRMPEDLPPEVAEPERRHVAETGMRSLLSVPLHVGGRLAAILTTGCFRAYRDWTPTDSARLRLVGTIFANAVYRRQSEAALRSRIAEIAALKDRLEAENILLRDEVRAVAGFDEIVSGSPVMAGVLAEVAQVAPTDATVLLLGETGTGKELVANAIHERSARRGRPLVKMNCAAVPPTLIESELFGHEKGAFTGAQTARVGRFEMADGGSIFLDEIGDLSLDLQGKLLRVLAEGTFERVGSSRTRQVNVRLTAATNRDLEAAMNAGTFREDLFYRLNVFPIRLPPLRERREDIPLLVWWFIQRKQPSLHRKIESIPSREMERLTGYDWPGNVRELANVVERALILANGPTLSFGADFSHAGKERSGELPARSDLSLDAAEREHIRAVLARCRWRVEGPGNAAEVLKVAPSTLRYRMKYLGIARPA